MKGLVVAAALEVRASFDGLWQLLVDSAEASVGEDRDYIAVAHTRHNLTDDGIGVRTQHRWNSASDKRFHDMTWLEAFENGNGVTFEDAGKHNVVSKREAFDEFALKDIPAKCI